MFDLELLEHKPTHRALAALDNAPRACMTSVVELLQARDFEHMVQLSVKDDQTRVLLAAATTSVLARGLGESKLFYSKVRSLSRRKPRAFPMVKTDNGHNACTPKEARETWMTQVSKRVGGTPVPLGTHFRREWEARREAADAPLSLIANADSLANEILSLPPDRATGSDGIPIRAVRVVLGKFVDHYFPLVRQGSVLEARPRPIFGRGLPRALQGFREGVH
jgi:hypothetical protein